MNADVAISLSLDDDFQLSFQFHGTLNFYNVPLYKFCDREYNIISEYRHQSSLC